MRIRLPSKESIIAGSKIFGGALAALVSIFSGQQMCAFGMFSACYDLGIYLPFGLFELSVTLLAGALLLSAFLDIFSSMGRIVLLERDVEVVAGALDGGLNSYW